MTKAIRIENADTSDHKVEIEQWDVIEDGDDILVATDRIDFPTAMANITIWDTRYLVIKEIKK